MRGGTEHRSHGNQDADKGKGIVASEVKTTAVCYSFLGLPGLPELWFLCDWNLNLTIGQEHYGTLSLNINR